MTQVPPGSTTMAVVVDGDLDVFAASLVRAELHRFVLAGAEHLQVDLSLVPWTNASALHHLAVTRAELATGPGVTLAVTRASAAVVKMSTLAHLDAFLGHDDAA